MAQLAQSEASRRPYTPAGITERKLARGSGTDMAAAGEDDSARSYQGGAGARMDSETIWNVPIRQRAKSGTVAM
jgi:hypothetical protein